MSDGKAYWLAIIDGRGGRLLRGRQVHPGRGSRLRLETVESIDNSWVELEGEQAALPTQRHAGDRRSELLARYALDLVKWLGDHVKREHVEELVVFAPPRLQALLQSMYAQSLSASITYHRADLGHLDVDELAREPEVMQYLEADRGDSRRAS